MLLSLASAGGCVGELRLGQLGGETESSAESDTDTADGDPTADSSTPVAAPGHAMAEALCGALFGCECSFEAPKPYETCVSEIGRARQEWFDTAAALGATVNEGCYARFMDFFGATEPNCGSIPQGTSQTLMDAAFCDLFDGPLLEGETCVESGIVTVGGPISACAPGLSCTDGVCRELPQVGEACLVPRFSAVCADGLVCDDDVCVDPPEQGESCVGTLACGGTDVCIQGLCEPPRAIGEPCSTDRHCETLACGDAGTCVSEPSVCLTSSSTTGIADGFYCDCFAFEGLDLEEELPDNRPRIDNHCDAPLLCDVELGLQGDDDDARAGLGCALEALAAGNDGTIIYERSFGFSAQVKEIFITGNGDAYVSQVAYDDYGTVLLSVVAVDLHDAAFFDACLQGSVEVQADCLEDLGTELLACGE